MELIANVEIRLMMREGETEEQVNNRLYDLLYDGLTNVADHHADFWIEETRVAD